MRKMQLRTVSVIYITCTSVLSGSRRGFSIARVILVITISAMIKFSNI